MSRTPGIRRRSLFAGAGAGAAALAAAPAAALAQPVPSGAGPLSTPQDAIVSTRSGKVRGFKRGGIYIFRGVPYGDDPSGEARFLPPRAPKPWTGVRTCLSYGPVSPQPPRDMWSIDVAAFTTDWNDGHPGEDCLTLNVWSSDLKPASPRPVMVWFHGGGFVAGSSYEQPAYEGSRLAARGAVVVSVNHRLGPLGFMDLSHIGGPDYARSGNAGILDLVLSLQWVRDNIASFGGDPNRVMIFGQSGGGGKVSSVMAMPEAAGLFHRAMVMSGSNAPGRPQAAARAYTDAVIKELGLAPGDLAGLRKVSAQRLVQAGDAVRLAAAPSAGPPPNWGPVRDGAVLPVDAWVTAAPAASAGVPMIIGSVRDEFKPFVTYDEAGLSKRAEEMHKGKGPAVVAALAKEFPSLSADDRAGVLSGLPVRRAVLSQAGKKAAQGGGAVYSYWFTLEPPLLDGTVGVGHCADIAYAFDNTRLSDQWTGDTPTARAVAERFSSALVQFAATGDPGLPGLAWPPYTEAAKATMVYDAKVGIQPHPASATLAASSA